MGFNFFKPLPVKDTQDIGFTLIFVFFVLIPFNAWSQTTNQLNTNIGIGNIALRDKSMSPLMYSGLGFSAALSFEHYSSSSTHFHQIKFDHAGINNQYDNSCTFFNVSYKSVTLYHKAREKQNRITWGWSNNNSFNYYDNEGFHNYSERSNYFTSFGPAASYTNALSIFGKEFVIELPADIQIIGFYLRPSYVASSPEGYLDPDNSGLKAFLKSIEAFLPNRAWNFGIRPKISYLLNSGNALSISYQYEFSRINNPEPVTQSSGVWYVCLTTKL